MYLEGVTRTVSIFSLAPGVALVPVENNHESTRRGSLKTPPLHPFPNPRTPVAGTPDDGPCNSPANSFRVYLPPSYRIVHQFDNTFNKKVGKVRRSVLFRRRSGEKSPLWPLRPVRRLPLLAQSVELIRFLCASIERGSY